MPLRRHTRLVFVHPAIHPNAIDLHGGVLSLTLPRPIPVVFGGVEIPHGILVAFPVAPGLFILATVVDAIVRDESIVASDGNVQQEMELDKQSQ